MGMRILFDLFLTACYLVVSFCASVAAADDSWQNLKHVTQERYYTAVDRRSNCITGHIVMANDHEFTLKLPSRTSATFDRANVLRVSVSHAAPYLPPRVEADVGRVYDVIYNDKSSWSDLKGVAGREKIGASGQEVKVVKTDGKTTKADCREYQKHNSNSIEHPENSKSRKRMSLKSITSAPNL
jgi:hypothetical protein